MKSMETKDVLLKYGWMEPKEAVPMHRSMTLIRGLKQSKIMKEKK